MSGTDHRSEPHFRCAVHEASHAVVSATFAPGRGIILFGLDAEKVPTVARFCYPTGHLPPWPRGTPKNRARLLSEFGLPLVQAGAVILAGQVGERLYVGAPDPASHRGDDADLDALELSAKKRAAAESLAERILTANRGAVFAVADRVWLNAGHTFWVESMCSEYGIAIERPEGVAA